MKVLQILNSLEYSGAEVMLKIAAPEFEKAGIENYILCTGEELGPYYETLKNAGYKITHIPFAKSISFLMSVFRFIASNKFAAVHIHPERGFIWYSLIARVSRVEKIFRTFHDVFLFVGFLRIKRMLQRKIAQYLCGVTFLAIGDSVKMIEEKVFYNKSRIIRNWVDEFAFRPPSDIEKKEARRMLRLNDRDVVVISVGTCNSKKNHKAIINACKQLSDSGIECYKYLHRGTGPDRLEEENYVKSIGLEDKVLFLDYCDEIHLPYWAADIFVMTSHYEGLGNVILEAMNCNLPVILYDVLGMRDTLPDKIGGYLVEKTEKALSEKLKLLITDDVLRNKMAEEAFKSVRKNYSMNNSIKEIIKLYLNNA